MQLVKLAREINVSIGQIVDYAKTQGFEIENKPTAHLCSTLVKKCRAHFGAVNTTIFERINKCFNLLEEKEGVKFHFIFDRGFYMFAKLGTTNSYMLTEKSHTFSSCLETLLKIVEEYCTEPTYSIGDRFKKAFGVYVLASAKDGHVILINPKTGGRWDDMFKVKDVMRVTKSEMEKGITRFDQFVKI